MKNEFHPFCDHCPRFSKANCPYAHQPLNLKFRSCLDLSTLMYIINDDPDLSQEVAIQGLLEAYDEGKKIEELNTTDIPEEWKWQQPISLEELSAMAFDPSTEDNYAKYLQYVISKAKSETEKIGRTINTIEFTLNYGDGTHFIIHPFGESWRLREKYGLSF